jgi:hypothetical protein
VTWSIQPPGTGSVNASGLYTAPASIASQSTVQVIATSVADGTKSASAAVTLNPPSTPPPGPQPSAIAIFGTGVANGGGLASDGTLDLHYTLVGGEARVVNSSGFPIPPWLSNGPASKWIAPQANQSSGNAGGSYTYRTTFSLTGLNPATAVLTGRWGCDDTCVMRLNGVTVATISAIGNFSSLTAFTISSGFAAGTNTLDFVVANNGSGANPTGLRVDISGTAMPSAGPVAVPVYGTGIASGGGLAADGTNDPHYTLVSSADPSFPGPNAVVITSNAFPIPPWAANGPSSKWIAPRVSPGSNNATGSYTYRTTFSLTGLNPSTVVLTGRWGCDDTCVMKLNGNTVATISAVGNFANLTSFTIDSGFTAGTNTLEFVVTNAGSSANPTGLRVEIAGTGSPN